MPESHLLDLFTTAEGDVVIGANGDLLAARDEEVVAQEVLWRCKTVRGDWVLFPECGADLEYLVGLPNSPETGAQAEALVNRALTHDSFLLGELERVEAVPINREQIAVFINIDYDGENPFTMPITVDLKEGVL